MAWLVILSIIALPLVEVAIFVEAAQALGVLPAIAAAVAAGIAGLALWRHQGLQTLRRARDAIDRGQMPVAEVFHGLCLMLSGALLLLPGFLSDVFGLLLLLPPVRALLAQLLARRFVVVDVPAQQPPGPKVIDADYVEIRGPDEPPRR